MSRGFSLLELICVIAILSILAALMLPGLVRARERARQTQCAGQLKEIGIAFHSFAHDHNNQFPMQVPAAAGGSMEFVQRAVQLAGDSFFAFRHFQALSNELGTPRVLVCPSDTRTPAATFTTLSNRNLSFFVGMNAQYPRPGSVLAGDRNVTNDWAPPTSVTQLGPNHALRWSQELHRFRGNLLFADGHVEQVAHAGLAGLGAGGTYVFNLPGVPSPRTTPLTAGPQLSRPLPNASKAKSAPAPDAASPETAGSSREPERESGLTNPPSLVPPPGDVPARNAGLANGSLPGAALRHTTVPSSGPSDTSTGAPRSAISGQEAAPGLINQDDAEGGGSDPAPSFFGTLISVSWRFLWIGYLGLVLLALFLLLLRRRLRGSK